MEFNINGNGSRIVVTLSKRNLQVLLNKLKRDDSKKTIVRISKGVVLSITAEEDDDHYIDREPGPVDPRDKP